MNIVSASIKMISKIDLKSKVIYVIRDIIFIYTFFALMIKTQLFLNVLKSSGASKLSSAFDLSALFNSYIFILFIILFISFTFLVHKKFHLWSLVIYNSLYSIILIGDLWHYRAFNSFLSLHLFKETQNLKNLSQGVMSMGRVIDLIFVVDIVIMIILAIILRTYYSKLPKVKGIFPAFFLIPLGLILVIHGMYDYNGANYKGPTLFKTQWIPYATMRNLSPLGYHIFDTFTFIDDNRPYIMGEKEKNDIKNWFSIKNEKLPDNKYKDIFKGKNLVIIQVESLENFVINQKYDAEEITPNLNKLLKNSLYFSNYYEQVNNGTSSDADLMTNASVYPVRRGSTFFRFPTNAYNTLPMLLNRNGYNIMALHSDYGYYWNVKNALINFGFDEFKSQETFPIKKTFWMGLTDECFFDQATTILENTKTPFYGFAVTSTSHMPFEMPPEFKNLKLDEAFDKTVMGGYFQSVNYADKQIGKFLDNLDKKGTLNNTVVVIYGDHTSIHKYYGDEVSKMVPQKKWWDNGKRVPLIIYSKGLEGEEIKTIGGQIDLLPTIAYTMGIKQADYENTALGRNLLKTNKSFALLADGTIIGKENLNKIDVDNINQSFDLSDKLIKSNYFKK